LYPFVCKFDIKDLLSCSSISATPTKNQSCTLRCDVKAGADDCAVDPCACTKTGKICSSMFPSSCKYETNSIYSCDEDHKTPTSSSACSDDQYCATLLDPSNPSVDHFATAPAWPLNTLQPSNRCASWLRKALTGVQPTVLSRRSKFAKEQTSARNREIQPNACLLSAFARTIQQVVAMSIQNRVSWHRTHCTSA